MRAGAFACGHEVARPLMLRRLLLLAVAFGVLAHAGSASGATAAKPTSTHRETIRRPPTTPRRVRGRPAHVHWPARMAPAIDRAAAPVHNRVAAAPIHPAPFAAAARAMTLTSRDAAVATFGDNYEWELGASDTLPASPIRVPADVPSGVTQIAAGATYFEALYSDGTLWAWGGSWSGAQGIGSSPYLDREPAQVAI